MDWLHSLPGKFLQITSVPLSESLHSPYRARARVREVRRPLTLKPLEGQGVCWETRTLGFALQFHLILVLVLSLHVNGLEI